MTRRLAKLKQEVADATTPPFQSSAQLFQQLPLPLDPLRRNFAGDAAQDVAIELLQRGQPWLERVPSGDRLVNFVPGIRAAQRRIRKCPFPRVKAIAVINE